VTYRIQSNDHAHCGLHKEVLNGEKRNGIHPPCRLQANNATQTQSKLGFSLSFYIPAPRDWFKSFTNLTTWCKRGPTPFSRSHSENGSSNKEKPLNSFNICTNCKLSSYDLLHKHYLDYISCISVKCRTIFCQSRLSIYLSRDKPNPYR
jgi:hypothetical protein